MNLHSCPVCGSYPHDVTCVAYERTRPKTLDMLDAHQAAKLLDALYVHLLRIGPYIEGVDLRDANAAFVGLITEFRR